MDYKVESLQDNEYQVVSYNNYDIDMRTVHFQGGLSDCEAWIRLTKEGYM